MKQFFKAFKERANRHEEEIIISILLIITLIGAIIGGIIGANFYQPVETTKIELLESIANDVWENTQEFVQKYSNISIELSSEELSEMIETDLSLFEDLTASVEKSTVKIFEKKVVVEVDFSQGNTNVQERNSKIGYSFLGMMIGAIGILIVALIIESVAQGIVTLMEKMGYLKYRFLNKRK